MQIRAEAGSEARDGAESMFDIPRHDEAALETRTRRFEASLAESLFASDQPEEIEAPPTESSHEELGELPTNRSAQDVPVDSIPFDRASATPSMPPAEEIAVDPNPRPARIDISRTTPPPVTTEAHSAEGVRERLLASTGIEERVAVARSDGAALSRLERSGAAEDQSVGAEPIRPVVDASRASKAQSTTPSVQPEEVVQDGGAERQRLESVATKSHLPLDADRLLRPERIDRGTPRETTRVAAGDTRTSPPPAIVRDVTPEGQTETAPTRPEPDVELGSRSLRESHGEGRPVSHEPTWLNAERPQATTTLRSPTQVDATPQPIQTVPAPTQSVSAPAEPGSELGPRQPIEALPREVELLASRGGGTARVRLHPANLGEVDITISIRRDAVDVVIHADEPAARAAILAHRDQLADALGARELRMQGFDVAGGNREHGAGDERAGWNEGPGRRDQPSQSAHSRVGRPTTDPNLESAVPNPAPAHAQRGIDVRI